MLESVRGQDWQTPTPIQQLVIPEIIQMEKNQHDSIWSEAPTGSGKTGAFALPLVQKLLRQKRNRTVKNESLDGRVATLVLVPTRELCVQIGNVFEDIIASLPRGRRNLDVISIYGGVPLEPQIEALAKRRKSGAGVDILVATPGRLVDVIKGASAAEEGKEPEEAALERRLLDALDASGRVGAALSLQQIQDLDLDRKDDDGRGALGDMLDSVKYLVLDEADRLLGQAFKKEMDSVLQLLPKPNDDDDDFFEEQKMRTLLFSATFPEQIQPRVETVLKRLSGNDTPPLRLSCSLAGIPEDDSEEMSKTRQNQLHRPLSQSLRWRDLLLPFNCELFESISAIVPRCCGGSLRRMTNGTESLFLSERDIRQNTSPRSCEEPVSKLLNCMVSLIKMRGQDVWHSSSRARLECCLLQTWPAAELVWLGCLRLSTTICLVHLPTLLIELDGPAELETKARP